MKRNEIAKLNSAQAATNRFGIGMLTPTLIVLLVMTAYPLIFTFVYSFTDYNYLKGTENASFVLFDNYVSLFKNGYFQQAVWNTIKFTILAVVLEMALGLLIAVFVNSLKRGQKIMRTLLLLPYLLPAVTVALSWRMMLSANYGIINQFLKGLGLPVFNRERRGRDPARARHDPADRRVAERPLCVSAAVRLPPVRVGEPV